MMGNGTERFNTALSAGVVVVGLVLAFWLSGMLAKGFVVRLLLMVPLSGLAMPLVYLVAIGVLALTASIESKLR